MAAFGGTGGRGGPERIRPAFPAVADVEASQGAKPRPTAAIVTDPVARAQHVAAIEAWGERVSDAAVRMCRQMNDMGGKLACGATPTERAARVVPR